MRPQVSRAVFLAAAFFGAAAPSADAAFTSTLAGGNISMVGDEEFDLMRIQRSGSLLVHDRADPGFSGIADWDTSQAGTQTLNASQAATVSIDAGPGGDIVILGGDGGSAAALVQDFDVDGGGGLDGLLIDSSADTLLASRTATFTASTGVGLVQMSGAGATGTFTHRDAEVVQMRFGDGSDTAAVNSTDSTAGVAIQGSAGTDTATVGAAGGLPLITGAVDFDGDAGANDHLNVTDAPTATGGTYLVTPSTTARAGFASIGSDASAERVTLTTTGQNDSIFKSGPRPVTINAGTGDDLISSRDPIGDTDNCGGGNDYVLSDTLDSLNDCEASDRTAPVPPVGDPGTGDPGTGTGTGTGTTPMMPMEMMDTTPPTASITGLKSSIRLKALLKGIKPMVLADERSSYEVELLGAPRSAQLARTYNLTLASRSLPADIGIRTASLKPNKRLIGKARKFTVRVAVTPTDASGNRGKTVVRNIKVKR